MGRRRLTTAPGGYVPRSASAFSAFSARRVIEASAPSAASARWRAVASAAGDAARPAVRAVRPDELPEDDPGEPDRDRARGGSSEERSEDDFERDRSESETARCSVDGDDRADQCSALASPWTESQCVGSPS